MQIKQHDTRPAYRCIIEFPAGTVLDLSTAAGVKFLMNALDGTAKVNRAATIVSATEGTVEHSWLAADTDTVGVYKAEWQVTWGDGSIQTFPTGGYLRVEVVDDLGS